MCLDSKGCASVEVVSRVPRVVFRTIVYIVHLQALPPSREPY